MNPYLEIFMYKKGTKPGAVEIYYRFQVTRRFD